MTITTLVSRKLLLSITTLLVSLSIGISINVSAQAQAKSEANDNPVLPLSIPAQSSSANKTSLQHKMLQQELRTLLAENTRINQEKIQYLEAQSQRVFWTQCLIGFLVLMMLISLWSFWRLHVQHKFQHGIDSLTTSLKHFQDSLFSLSFIDTSQLSTVSNVSSFHVTGGETEQPVTPANSQFRKTNNPNTGTHRDEFSDIRGFFDAWLNVYKPGDPRYEEAMAAANKPESPRPWLEMLEGFLKNKDQHGFEAISKEIKKFFNVKLHDWQTTAGSERKQLSDYPHVVQKITKLWPSDEVVVYLERLLNNSRMSPREGFDLPIFEQLESLLILAQRPDRPRHIQQLKRQGLADFLFQAVPTTQQTQPSKNATPAAEKTELKAVQVAKAPSVLPVVEIPVKADPMPVPVTPQAEAEPEYTTPTALAAENQTALSASNAAVDSGANTQLEPEIVDEETLFATNEVRLQLALAYREIADSEGACLLLEDVIREATPAQQVRAKLLLAEIEEKQARICGESEEIYFVANSALTAAKNV